MGGEEFKTSEEQLQQFRRHCKLYYQKSLSMNSDDNDDDSHGDDADLKVSKIVLDAFEHHQLHVNQSSVAVSTTTSPSTSSPSPPLLPDHHHEFKDVLKNCGLHHVVLNNKRLSGGDEIVPGLVNEEERSQESDYHESPRDHTELKNHEQQQQQQLLLLEYAKIKNEERRLAHEQQMEIRTQELRSLIYSENKKEESSKIDVTSQEGLNEIRLLIRNFVTKYKSNVGVHSFLGGIRKLMECQLSCSNDERVQIWKFNALLLSESAIVVTTTTTTTPGNENVTGPSSTSQYMKDAVNVLQSFLILYYPPTPDEEEGSGTSAPAPAGKNRDDRVTSTVTAAAAAAAAAASNQQVEEIVHYCIHPTMSDTFIKILLRELPKPKELETRPTGKIMETNGDGSCSSSCSSSSSNDEEKQEEIPPVRTIRGQRRRRRSTVSLRRINRDGHLDESLSGMDLIQSYWNQSIFCEIL